MDDVPEQFLPSDYQRGLWASLIIEGDGTDVDGFWHAFCPLHDKHHDPEKPSALINFQKGVMKCLGDPCCHKGRAISLTNTLNRMYRHE